MVSSGARGRRTGSKPLAINLFGSTTDSSRYSEDAKKLTLMTPEGKLVTVDKSQIDQRATGKSAMPQDVAKPLSKSDLRDVVEFLAGLKG